MPERTRRSSSAGSALSLRQVASHQSARGEVAPVFQARVEVLAPRLVDGVDQEAETALAQPVAQLHCRIAVRGHGLAPHARQKSVRGFRRFLRGEAHKQGQVRAGFVLQPGDCPVERNALEHRRLARAGLRQQDEGGMPLQGSADVGQRDALDLALRPLPAHKDGAVGRGQLRHGAIAARQRHVALLPLLKVRVHAQVEKVLAGALRRGRPGRRGEELVQRVGQLRRHADCALLRPHLAGAQPDAGRPEQGQEGGAELAQLCAGYVDRDVGDVVAADKHLRIDAAADGCAAASDQAAARGGTGAAGAAGEISRFGCELVRGIDDSCGLRQRLLRRL